MNTENLSRSEAQQRSAALDVISHSIDLNVTEAPSAGETFTVTSRIEIAVHQTIETFADFIGEDAKLSVDGVEVDPRFDGARVYLPPLQPGSHMLTINATGLYSTTGEGLHRFRDPQDGQTYLYTQFEPADARRVFPNFEQPDLKTEFRISISAPESWTILSNSAEARRESIGTNSLGTACVQVFFAPTKRQSTYLTAFIAGPYVGFHDVAHTAQGPIDLGFYCRATLAEHFDLDDISTVTKQGLQTFPQAFGSIYPWGKYDSVFVPEYNLGAMENPGCVTFSEDAYIYRGLSTRAQRAGRANTILHEMSHMWFGDYTTPVWWDDLWLKESFAEFMGAWGCAKSTQYTEAWVDFAGARLNWALSTDQLPTTHPIVADIADLEAADQAFDGITYAKGAAVLRQLVAFVGEEQFFAGVRQFFADHAFANATLSDLLSALESSSGRDLHEWSKQWLHTTGVSTITVERTEQGVILTQTGTDSVSGASIERPHRIRVSGFSATNGTLHRIASYDVDLRKTVTIPWSEIGGADVDLILPNDDSLSYVKVAFDDQSLAAALSNTVAEPLSRSVISGQLWQMTYDGLLSPTQYAQFIDNEPLLSSASLLAQRTRSALSALRNFTNIARREADLNDFFDQALRARDLAEPGSDPHTIWTRTIALVGAYLPQRDDDIAFVLEHTTDQDLRWMLLSARAVAGTVSPAVLDDELASSGSASDVVAHLKAMTSLPGKRKDTLERLLHDKLSNDHLSAMIDGFTQYVHRAEASQALPDYFDKIEAIWASRSQELAERLIYGLYPFSDLLPGERPEDNTDVKAATRWLDESLDAPPALRKIILDQRDFHLRSLRNQMR
ncbi:aminopeptidase N [Arcanobacterium pinnipediorum]|uniref:Aminopeptidase N n=1 Tax=Arcanobacterium pinnipediorum TaxID=1503041 RepID=A0ABY5AF10_9ACTO|nr:aminopeptidase N [Arcanobacterium pinnipediorum]USR78637.1 aminopeptidase N [Arcanobacterium pinnipediorum]